MLASIVEPAIYAGWLTFLLFWGWRARGNKPAQRGEAFAPRFFKYILPLIIAILLIEPLRWYSRTWLGERFLPHGWLFPVLGAALVWLGVLLCCWARVVLGRNWSSVVQIKQDHELVRNGPYRVVRHPIYSGLLLAFLGTALAIGEWRGLLATAIAAGSFWIKLRLEERWMRERFGEAYVDYMRHSKALVPWLI